MRGLMNREIPQQIGGENSVKMKHISYQTVYVVINLFLVSVRFVNLCACLAAR